MSTPDLTTELTRLLTGEHHDPHSVLGPHIGLDGVVVRVLRPMATTVTVVTPKGRHPLEHERHGVWQGLLPTKEVPDYRLEVEYDGKTVSTDDPYRFLPTLGEVDLHLIGEGRHEKLWSVLGAHVRSFPSVQGEITGTSFAVWAPNARGVRVSGDFNQWDSVSHPMRSLGSSGVWELFVPGVGSGSRYRFDVYGRDGVWRGKADPMAFYAETEGGSASVVFESSYTWKDDDWLEQRAQGSALERPMSIYEMHLGSWLKDRSYQDLAEELVSYLGDLGFTHVEMLPVMEHPFGGSWGYQVSSYYAPTSRHGDPDGFRYLVDRLHQAGIGVIVDWVPAHFPKDAWALAEFDGGPLYEHADPTRGEHPDWGTLIFDFGRPEVRNFLVANALYWLEEFHVDGLRVDAVASMLYLDYSRPEGTWKPNVHGGRENLEAVSFVQEMNATCYKRVPGIVTIAEESTSWPGVTRPTHLGGLGFGMKWNMGWMHDSLSYMRQDPIYRQFHHQSMTFSMMYAYSENFVLPLSHDEVVHGKGSLLRKMPGDRWRELANLRAYLTYMWAHPGKQLVFMGSELGQESEWSEARELDWWLLDHVEHRGLHTLVRDLNRTYREHPALWALDHDPAGFSWIDPNDASNNVFSFIRTDGQDSLVVCVANFSAVPHEGYRLGFPQAGVWRELLNTDAELYYGSGVGNLGRVEAVDEPWHGQRASAVLRLPPLGTVMFAFDADAGTSSGSEKASEPRAAAQPEPSVRPQRRTSTARRPKRA